MHTTYI